MALAERIVYHRLPCPGIRPSVTLGFGGAENRSGVRAGEESPNTAGRDAA